MAGTPKSHRKIPRSRDRERIGVNGIFYHAPMEPNFNFIERLLDCIWRKVLFKISASIFKKRIFIDFSFVASFVGLDIEFGLAS